MLGADPSGTSQWLPFCHPCGYGWCRRERMYRTTHVSPLIVLGGRLLDWGWIIINVIGPFITCATTRPANCPRSTQCPACSRPTTYFQNDLEQDNYFTCLKLPLLIKLVFKIVLHDKIGPKASTLWCTMISTN